MNAGTKSTEIDLDQAAAGMTLASALLDAHGGVLLPRDAVGVEQGAGQGHAGGGMVEVDLGRFAGVHGVSAVRLSVIRLPREAELSPIGYTTTA